MSTRVLVVTRGHDFDHNAFIAMFAAMEGVDMTMAQQPAAQAALTPAHVSDYDVVFFYDMSGIPNIGLNHDRADADGNPDPAYAASIEALLDTGVGILLANHATVSWPNWPLWREITGSSYLLREGEIDGVVTPGSGYRGGHGPLPNATVKLIPQADHPVLAGLEGGFEITDELYLKSDGFETHVSPLIRADYDFVYENFTPPPLAPPEQQQGWQHPPGSNLVVWTHRVRNANVVVTDLGDGPLAFENPDFRRLLENACHWLALRA